MDETNDIRQTLMYRNATVIGEQLDIQANKIVDLHQDITDLRAVVSQLGNTVLELSSLLNATLAASRGTGPT